MSGSADVTSNVRTADGADAGSSTTLASVVATGPWVLTILSLAVISVMTRNELDLESLAAFRTIIIYAFATSLIVTAPITIIATREAGDLLHGGHTEALLQSFLMALLIGAALAAAAFAAFAVAGVTGASAIATLVCSSIISFVWITLAFATALRDYRAILVVYCAGLAISTAGAVIAARSGYDFIGVVAGFSVGQFVIALGLCYRLLDGLRAPVPDIAGSLRSLARLARRHSLIALGAAFVAAGVWVDKWIIWSGHEGVTAKSGLVHAPAYDGAMFIAYLSIVPALILFVGVLETSFTRGFRRYFLSIGAHATLSTIKRNASQVATLTFHALLRTSRAQVIICLIVVMAAPNIVNLAGLRYEDTGLLRVGAIGAGFHFLFLACMSLLLFFDRREEFCQLGACQFALNSTFTAATLWAGPDYYGLGYLAAAVVSSLIAFAAVERSVRELTYFTFSRALGAQNA
jgi:uncharacterized membrane protein